MGRMFQFEGESISAWECRVVERAKHREFGNFEDYECRDRFIAGLGDETLMVIVTRMVTLRSSLLSLTQQRTMNLPLTLVGL